MLQLTVGRYNRGPRNILQKLFFAEGTFNGTGFVYRTGHTVSRLSSTANPATNFRVRGNRRYRRRVIQHTARVYKAINQRLCIGSLVPRLSWGWAAVRLRSLLDRGWGRGCGSFQRCRQGHPPTDSIRT